MTDEITKRVLNDDRENAANTSMRRTIANNHRSTFVLFIATSITLSVMFLQGLVAGKIYVGLLPWFLIPGYCLYVMRRGVRGSNKGEQ